MALMPALAADPATQSGADTSTGAKEQSSAPPSSGAAEEHEAGRGHEADHPAPGDTSGVRQGSKVQPHQNLPAADPSKPNPTLGTDKE